MDSKRVLNLDIDEKINEFKSMLKEFGLKRKKIVFIPGSAVFGNC